MQIRGLINVKLFTFNQSFQIWVLDAHICIYLRKKIVSHKYFLLFEWVRYDYYDKILSEFLVISDLINGESDVIDRKGILIKYA